MATKYRFKNSKRRKSKQRKFTSKGGVATLTEPTKSRVITKKDEDQKSIDFQNMMAGFLNGCLEYAKEQNDQNLIEGLQSHSLYRYIERQRQREKEKEGYKVAINVIKEHTQNAYKLIDACSGNRSEAFERFREQYMKQFSKDERQKGGKVYTPPEIVKWIHDKLEEQSPLSLHKTYWDPACGTGHFPLDWYDRLVRHWEENKDLYPEIKDEHEAHKWIVEKCIYFSDIDPFAIRLCKFGLFLKDPTIQPEFNAFLGDSLLDEPFGDRIFDYMAGNPPYIGFFKGPLEATYKERLKQEYSFYQAKGDILNLFFELGYERSRTLGFITSRYWLETPCLTLMRESLRPHIREIWDHGNDKSQFQGSPFVLTSCFVFDFTTDEGMLRVNAKDLDIKYLEDDGWFLQSDAICEKLLLQKRLTDYITPYDGINTGCNSVFVVPEHLAQERGFRINKWVSGKAIRKYKTNWLRETLVYCTEDEYIKQSTPEAIYLQENKEILEERVGHKMPYEYQSSNLDRWDNIGILSRYYMDHNHYGFSLQEDYYGAASNVRILVPEDDISVKSVLAVLNSNVTHYFFKKRVKRRANNYMITIPVYETIPMPNHLSVELEPLVDKMLENPNDTETQAEIDKIVYDLYGLTEEEIKVIEEAVK